MAKIAHKKSKSFLDKKMANEYVKRDTVPIGSRMETYRYLKDKTDLD